MGVSPDMPFLAVTSTIWIFVKFRIECIEIFAVQMFLDNSKTFTESLVMYDLTLSQKTDRIADFRIFYKS